mmetsp:Transcript_8200/g.17798  ORF Transcript_8200/g.17798 Transcript_8200/m.17798 type:complete len:194 (-) Transcript_8200:102-683(-)|eukprot:CAMPEP_0204468636 /NCGR_PEP_ID=MMETSP0471-20130131/10652_1 /ASSEMBLY_ACC=CAM_ASM_000602 /TAXON_ID=2969 /ORGANISM="Oxyrrhis marina" /LENGTH=193 /DNA_ID=CAMNT_0051470465 /DNA_START=41 /DNA_END=622 /DNA_ORIENTATION=+
MSWSERNMYRTTTHDMSNRNPVRMLPSVTPVRPNSVPAGMSRPRRGAGGSAGATPRGSGANTPTQQHGPRGSGANTPTEHRPGTTPTGGSRRGSDAGRGTPPITHHNYGGPGDSHLTKRMTYEMSLLNQETRNTWRGWGENRFVPMSATRRNMLTDPEGRLSTFHYRAGYRHYMCPYSQSYKISDTPGDICLH